jgi:myosin heavy subunit
LESEVKILKEEIEMRKQQLKVKSEETTSQASRIAELESMNDVGSKSAQQVQNLEDEANSLRIIEESLRNELASQRALVDQERKQTTKAQALLKAQYVNESIRLEQLRREIDAYKEADKKKFEQEELIVKLRKDINDLEKRIEEFQGKEAMNHDMDAKVRAAEIAHERETSSLKAKLSEAEKKYGEVCHRADEERKAESEKNARYELELEEMRRDNEKATEDKMKLREELEELRKLLASGITGAIGRPLATIESFEQSSKVNKLRSDLAVARARLVAAREQTGHFTTTSTSPAALSVPGTEDVVSCDQSVSSSLGSSWVPKGPHESPLRNRFTKLGEKNTRLDEVMEHSDAPRYNVSIEEKKEDHPQPLISVDAPLDEVDLYEPRELTSNNVSSRKAPGYSQTSLLDDEDDDEALPESSLPPRPPSAGERNAVTPLRNPARTSVDELRRQLRESSKRLEQANSRLSSLADQNLPSPMKTNFFSSSPFRGINHNMISSLENPDTMGGIVEEMVTSEDDAIEVQQVRYADI